ncbi:cytidylyltransferase domain-containing protein [Roseivirga misakiensis]|uniref:Aminotransferase n=1 Tax=Roseivirga misakiensis TaxID=1563681 RepID=A0A1E5T1H0_9BACT|nr:hypothetical protein [Roseivirga misakiensis]OEK05206.1 hypothetical protein BFP71_17535 [Roseivirga misakiensis]
MIIVQARLSSARLPGKILKPFFNGKSILDLQFEALKALKLPFVLATTTNKADDLLVEWAQKNEVQFFRGSEHNVLQRFIDCAEQHDAEFLIRICSDNPFIQTTDITGFLQKLKAGVDYVSFSDYEGVPAIRKHWGLFVEGVSLKALKKADALLEDDESFYREHVTNFIYGHADKFDVELIPAVAEIIHRNDLRFTIDTEQDFNNMQNLATLVSQKEASSIKGLVDIVDAHQHFLKEMKEGIAKFNK